MPKIYKSRMKAALVGRGITNCGVGKVVVASRKKYASDAGKP